MKHARLTLLLINGMPKTSVQASGSTMDVLVAIDHLLTCYDDDRFIFGISNSRFTDVGWHTGDRLNSA